MFYTKHVQLYLAAERQIDVGFSPRFGRELRTSPTSADRVEYWLG